jgi:hypothetical protein
MEAIRGVLKSSLARSFSAMPIEDRVAAAWPIACGRMFAGKVEFVSFNHGRMYLRVLDDAWNDQIMSLSNDLAREVAFIAGVPVTGIHFERMVGLKGKLR